ncbi:MAG: PepSY domain-containing protein [Eubacterium sp.]|nr:PepSY domain-containing protein [Eubacterium sp.]
MMKKNIFAAGITAFALSAAMAFGVFGAQSVSAAVQNPATITVKEAKKEALTDAGIKKSDAVFKKAALDYDDDTGITKFEVDFYANDKDYEYDIDASTAKILKSEVDMMDAEDYQEMQALQEAAAAAETSAQGITADQALEIALNDAGLTAGQVSYADTHLDYDDDYGMTDYDVEFHVGNKEYSYDINPATGAILNCDIDIDD